jgi:hypothetical protein
MLLVVCGDTGVDEVPELETPTLELDCGRLIMLLEELCGVVDDIQVVIVLLLVVSDEIGAVLEDRDENTGPIDTLELVVSLLNELGILVISLALDGVEIADIELDTELV